MPLTFALSVMHIELMQVQANTIRYYFVSFSDACRNSVKCLLSLPR